MRASVKREEHQLRVHRPLGQALPLCDGRLLRRVEVGKHDAPAGVRADVVAWGGRDE